MALDRGSKSNRAIVIKGLFLFFVSRHISMLEEEVAERSLRGISHLAFSSAVEAMLLAGDLKMC
jgi:hypothetical protein